MRFRFDPSARAAPANWAANITKAKSKKIRVALFTYLAYLFITSLPPHKPFSPGSTSCASNAITNQHSDWLTVSSVAVSFDLPGGDLSTSDTAPTPRWPRQGESPWPHRGFARSGAGQHSGGALSEQTQQNQEERQRERGEEARRKKSTEKVRPSAGFVSCVSARPWPTG
jgi:hypothetical protein